MGNWRTVMIGPIPRPRDLLIGVLVLVLVAGILMLTSPPAHAAAISVTTTVDENNVDGDCSLREAIIAANGDVAVDACAAGSGADVISVPAGTYTLSLAGAGEDVAASGDIDLSDGAGVTIDGAGARSTTIDADGIDRVFHLTPGVGNVLIGDLTVTGGNTAGGGGGVLVEDGSLTLEDVHVAGNSATADGGGIEIVGGGAEINGSLVSSNASDADGGGMAIGVAAGAITVTNSTFYDNTAATVGGGIYAAGGGVSLRSLTVSGNSSGSAGGVFAEGAASPSFEDTIVAGNTGFQCDLAGSASSGGNTYSDSTCPAGGFDQIDVDPALIFEAPGTPADNGGPTDTIALSATSPAIDFRVAILPACAATDQRGEARPQDGDDDAIALCDSGAYEYVLPPPPPPPPAPVRYELTVTKDGSGTGTVIDDGLFGIDCGSDCASFRNELTQGTLTASPDDDSAFTGWSGPCLEIDDQPFDECTILLTGHQDVTATFEETVTFGPCKGYVFGTTTALPGGGLLIVGTQGRDVIRGTEFDDIICGMGGEDVIRALEGDDLATGNAANDWVYGGPGHDEIRGGRKNDRLIGGPGNDLHMGQQGNDDCFGGGGINIFRACSMGRTIGGGVISRLN